MYAWEKVNIRTGKGAAPESVTYRTKVSPFLSETNTLFAESWLGPPRALSCIQGIIPILMHGSSVSRDERL